MDSKLLLVKCITLLYREAELKQGNYSTELCRSVIDNIKIPEASIMDVQSGREVIVALRSTVLWMMEQNITNGFDKIQLLQRVRINTKDDTYLYNAIVEGIEPALNVDELKKQILSYRSSLKRFIDNQQINSIILQSFQKLSFNTEEIDYRSFVRDVYTKLEPFTHDIVIDKHPAIVDSISFDDPEGMEKLLTRAKETISLDGVIKTGYQAINRMLGEHQGLRRGETVVVGALQHNFKTGFTLNLFKHAALYNKPYMRDPSKKPLLVHVSLENELEMNILWLYANIKENETGEPCDTSLVNVSEAKEYVIQKLTQNGYHIKMMRIEPSLCRYHDFFDMLTTYESEGYEIHLVVADYLSMMNKEGLAHSGATGTDIRDLYRRTRNFCAPRGITFVTPHQLSTEAKNLVRMGVNNFVQEIANKGYYEGSKQIDQEVDLELYIHIEKVKGKGSFLTVQRGKHRKTGITPEDDLYTVLPFNPVGGILDDILGEDTSASSVGGKSTAEGGGDWFDT